MDQITLPWFVTLGIGFAQKWVSREQHDWNNTPQQIGGEELPKPPSLSRVVTKL